jgi:transposase
MQGRQNRQPMLFSVVNLEALVPQGHLLRRVDTALDLSFVRELTSELYSQTQGRPSIDPETYVRMLLIQYLYDVDSDRALCEEIGYNLAYRWFCRFSLEDEIPNHSSMTRIRDRLGERTFEAIFLRVVQLCKEKGLVRGRRLMADGSHIAANASIYTMQERAKPEEQSEEKRPDDDDDEGKGKGGNERRFGQRGSQDGLSNNDIRRNSLVGKKIANQTHFSPTDPEATLTGKHMEYKSLRYKTHHIADADSRVILDCHVTTGRTSEGKVFAERLEKTRQDFTLPIEEVIADRGYGSGENHTWLKDLGIDANIALWSSRIGTALGKREGFTFDSKKITVTCPAGHLMPRKRDGVDNYYFAMSRATCRACPLAKSCLKPHELKAEKRSGKTIRVSIFQGIYDEVLEKEKLPEFRQKLRERMWKMEGLFAEAKGHHGLRRARYRGRSKVQVQVFMTSAIQNLKRLLGASLCDLFSALLELAKIERAIPNRRKFENFRLAFA